MASDKQVSIRMKADDIAEVLLYDVIGEDFFGEGVTAKSFHAQIKSVKAKVLNLRINSPGGSVTEGAAMLSALDEWRKGGRRIEVDVDGIAASAASVVMMAGNVVRVASNGLVMIHDPFAMVGGTASEMRRMADLLDKVKGQLLDAYMRRSRLSRDELSAAMEAETWYTGQEAVEVGLADSVGEQMNMAAFAGMTEMLARMKYKRVPNDAIPDEKARWAETERRRKAIARFNPDAAKALPPPPAPAPEPPPCPPPAPEPVPEPEPAPANASTGGIVLHMPSAGLEEYDIIPVRDPQTHLVIRYEKRKRATE